MFYPRHIEDVSVNLVGVESRFEVDGKLESHVDFSNKVNILERLFIKGSKNEDHRLVTVHREWLG